MIRVYYASANFQYNLPHSHLSHITSELKIIHCCFFYKGKWLASITEVQPNKRYVLSIFHVEKESCKANIEINQEVNCIDICPEDGEILSISGSKFFKLFKFDVQEKKLTE